MNYWESHTQVAVRFRRFDRKRYAAFRSMHKVINIGVVTASTLLFPARHGASPKGNRA